MNNKINGVYYVVTGVSGEFGDLIYYSIFVTENKKEAEQKIEALEREQDRRIKQAERNYDIYENKLIEKYGEEYLLQCEPSEYSKLTDLGIECMENDYDKRVIYKIKTYKVTDGNMEGLKGD